MRIFFILFFFFIFDVNAANIQKWVDENGKVHFGQVRPQGSVAEQIEVRGEFKTTEEINERATEYRIQRKIDADLDRIKEATRKAEKQYERAQRKLDRDLKRREKQERNYHTTYCRYLDTSIANAEDDLEDGYSIDDEKRLKRRIKQNTRWKETFCN